MKLDKIRKEIDEIDSAMLNLFEKRMHLSKEVVDYKIKNHMEIFQKDREQEVLEKNLNKLNDKNLYNYARNFILQNMNLSKRYQATFLKQEELSFDSVKKDHLVIGYQGIPGSFSHQAVNTYFKEGKQKHYDSFEDVFKALGNHEIDYGVLPLENSTTGAINDNYDLITEYGFYIVGEQSLSVGQHLLGVKGSHLKDIKKVYSHPQGILQSSHFLHSHHISSEAYPNTAMAAKMIACLQNKQLGAIASLEAAKLYGLDIIATHIEDDDTNHTRFIIIGRHLESHQEASRISTVFTLRHAVGALYEVMKIVNDHQMNMARIESRPIPHTPWEYYFYMDIDGNLHDPDTLSCIEEIKACTSGFRLLGNYQRK